MKRTRRVLSLNLLRGLRKRRVGTHAIEKMARNLTEVKDRQEKVVIKLLDIAIDAAEEKAAKASREADKSMKEVKRALPVGWQRRRFREILRDEAKDMWKERKEKIRKRKTTLKQNTSPGRRTIFTEAFLSVTELWVRRIPRSKSLQLALRYLRMKKIF